jgi:hypothetical protein
MVVGKIPMTTLHPAQSRTIKEKRDNLPLSQSIVCP